LDFAVPASKIAGLSSGEFVGMVADDPTEKIRLKTFHSEILNNHEALKKETQCYEELPIVTYVNQKLILENYFQIKKEVEDLIGLEIEILLNTPGSN